jgi:hypothetical protein
VEEASSATNATKPVLGLNNKATCLYCILGSHNGDYVDVTPCSLVEVHKHFGATYCPPLQGKKSKPIKQPATLTEDSTLHILILWGEVPSENLRSCVYFLVYLKTPSQLLRM